MQLLLRIKKKQKKAMHVTSTMEPTVLAKGAPLSGGGRGAPLLGKIAPDYVPLSATCETKVATPIDIHQECAQPAEDLKKKYLYSQKTQVSNCRMERRLFPKCMRA